MRMVLPSGLNATAMTSPRCGKGDPIGWPVAASQSRAVLSLHPVRTVLPSGLNATRMTAPRWCRGLADGPAGGGVPEPRRAVVAAGEDGLAVGAEGGGIDRTFVGEDRLESGVMRLPGGQVGPRGVLPGRIAGRDRRPPALDHPEQARADLLLLEGGLAAVEVADRQQAVRFGQRCREASRCLPRSVQRVISRLAFACSRAK